MISSIQDLFNFMILKNVLDKKSGINLFVRKIKCGDLMKRNIAFLIMIIGFVCLFGQGAGGGAAGNVSAFSFSGTLNEAGQLQMLTYIWGHIPRPGLYIVPDDTDVLTLISLAGGPTDDAKIRSIRIVRGSPDSDGEVIFVDIKQYLETGDLSLIPILKPGDTVVVSGSTFWGFRRFVQVLSNIATTLSIWILIQNL